MTSAEKFYIEVAKAGKNLLNPSWVTENYKDAVDGYLVEAVTMVVYVMKEDGSGVLLVQHPTHRQEYFHFFTEANPSEKKTVEQPAEQPTEQPTEQPAEQQTEQPTGRTKLLGFVKNFVDKFRK